VTEQPEVNNKTVFARGYPQGLTTSMPFGGQTPPIHKLGDNLK